MRDFQEKVQKKTKQKTKWQKKREKNSKQIIELSRFGQFGKIESSKKKKKGLQKLNGSFCVCVGGGLKICSLAKEFEELEGRQDGVKYYIS